MTPTHRDAGAPVVEALAAFEDLASSVDKLAPTMREIARDEKIGEKSLVTDILQTDKDACVRLAFAATTELRAVLEDQKGLVLAETKATSGALGERGPVCVRKGGTIRARFEGDGPLRVRFVTWSSP
ncbi:MAG: hypothetical protein ABIP89_25215 [Polyangiaceae bacterium]